MRYAVADTVQTLDPELDHRRIVVVGEGVLDRTIP
jgi:hypothetical protein